MKTPRDSLPFRFLMPILSLLCIFGGVRFAAAQNDRGLLPVFAQTEEVKTDDVSPSEPPQTPVSLPHGKFLWDYLLVAGLFAGTLYAVCRSSRRV